MSEAAVPRPRAVLLVHGAGGGGWEWNVWSRVFAAAGWNVEILDLLPASAGLAATRFDDYRAQVARRLAAMPRPRALVGASLGGLLALRCADGADALVLVNPLPPASCRAGAPAAQAPVHIEAWGARASLAGTRRAVPDAGAGDAWFAFRRWRDESGAVLAEARAGVACAPPDCPVLVVASSRDADVSIATSRRIAEAFAASWQELEGASHVGALFGSRAGAAAVRVIMWLNVKFA